MDCLVFIACHPDDEALSSGALLLKAKRLGYNIHLVWATSGEKSSSHKKSVRRKEANRVAETLKAECTFLDFTDTELQIGPVIGSVDDTLKNISPTVAVWPQGMEDGQHQDHVVLHKAILNITKRWKYTHCCWMVAQPPVFNDPNFKPQIFMGFGQDLLVGKQELMRLYSSERNKRFARPDFIENMAKHWAYQGQIMSDYCEPYELQKGIPPEELFKNDVIFYKELDGSRPVAAYINSLKGSDADLGECLYLIDLLREQGELLPSTFIEKLPNGLLVGKTSKSRILIACVNGVYVLLDALRYKEFKNRFKEVVHIAKKRVQDLRESSE